MGTPAPVRRRGRSFAAPVHERGTPRATDAGGRTDRNRPGLNPERHGRRSRRGRVERVGGGGDGDRAITARLGEHQSDEDRGELHSLRVLARRGRRSAHLAVLRTARQASATRGTERAAAVLQSLRSHRRAQRSCRGRDRSPGQCGSDGDGEHATHGGEMRSACRVRNPYSGPTWMGCAARCHVGRPNARRRYVARRST